MKSTFLVCLFFSVSTIAFAQTPYMFSYQAMARSASGQPIINTVVKVKFTILKGSETGQEVFAEEQNLPVNNLGLFTTQIGKTGNLKVIDWAKDKYFIKIETPDGIIGIQQLLSVPYSLFTNTALVADTAKVALSIKGGVSGDNWGTQVAVTDNTSLQGNGVIPLSIKEGGIKAVHLAQMDAKPNEVLKWDDTKKLWSPQKDETLVVSTTNTLTATSNAITSTVNGVASKLTPQAGIIAQSLGFDSLGNLVKDNVKPLGGKLVEDIEFFNTTEKRTSIITGNSIALGEYLHPDPTKRLDYNIKLLTNAAAIVNLGVGNTLANEFPFGSIPTYSSAIHDYFIIKYGENDIGYYSKNIDTTTYKTLIQNAVNACKVKGWPSSKIVVVSPVFISWTGFGIYADVIGETRANISDARTQNFVKATKNIAATLKTIYANIYDITKSDTAAYLADGLHLTAKGSEVVARSIVSQIRNLQGYEPTLPTPFMPLAMTPSGIKAVLMPDFLKLNGIWSQTGNSETTAGLNFIGTTDAQDFVMKSNNVEKIRILSTSSSAPNSGIVLTTINTKQQTYDHTSDGLGINSSGEIVHKITPSFMQNSQNTLRGGGTRTYDGSFLSWSSTFIISGSGVSNNNNGSGLWYISMPPAGTIIQGYGGAPDKTVSASGIQINGWHSLYYELPTSSVSSIAGNFKAVAYGSVFKVPDNWILLYSCSLNESIHNLNGLGVNYIKWADGFYQLANEDLSIKAYGYQGKIGISTTAPTNKLHVVATSNPVRFEGLQTGTTSDNIVTTDATGVFRKLPISIVTNSAVITGTATFNLAIAAGSETTVSLPISGLTISGTGFYTWTGTKPMGIILQPAEVIAGNLRITISNTTGASLTPNLSFMGTATKL